MATISFVEFITLSSGVFANGPYLIHEVHSRRKVAVSAVPTGEGTETTETERPAAPARAANKHSSPYFAFVTAIGGDVVALAGTNPIADQDTGKLVLEGTTELIEVKEGDLVSLVLLDVA